MLVLALQQKGSKLAELDQLSTQYICKPESVRWSYYPPRSFHALDLAVSQDRLDERYKDALSKLPDDIFSTVCKVPTIKKSVKKRKKKNTNCVGESTAIQVPSISITRSESRCWLSISIRRTMTQNCWLTNSKRSILAIGSCNTFSSLSVQGT
jgi:hypothetical protein